MWPDRVLNLGPLTPESNTLQTALSGLAINDKIWFRSYGPDTVYYMELSQGQIIQKAKMQELSSLFMTHGHNVMHAPVKFHEYIPYGLGVMAQTRFTVWN